MKTLVIYDDSGYIYIQISGTYRLPEGGLQFIETEIPEGKVLKSIDVSITPNKPIYEDMPKSDIENLKQQIADLQNYIIAKESNETTNL